MTVSASEETKYPEFTENLFDLQIKWVKDVNIGAKTIKLLEENIAVNFHILEFGNRLLDVTPKS